MQWRKTTTLASSLRSFLPSVKCTALLSSNGLSKNDLTLRNLLKIENMSVRRALLARN